MIQAMLSGSVLEKAWMKIPQCMPSFLISVKLLAADWDVLRCNYYGMLPKCALMHSETLICHLLSEELLPSMKAVSSLEIHPTKMANQAHTFTVVAICHLVLISAVYT